VTFCLFLCSELTLEVCPSILDTSCKIILLTSENQCTAKNVYTTSSLSKMFNTVNDPSDLEQTAQRTSRTATSGVANHILQTTNPALLFQSRQNCPSALYFLLQFVNKSTFPFVIKYFTYSTTLHGCKIWTIKQMRYKKSKESRNKFMIRTAGCTLLHHRKNKSTLKQLA
jgi:hypothetical protein